MMWFWGLKVKDQGYRGSRPKCIFTLMTIMHTDNAQSHMAVKIDNVICGLRLFYFKFCTVPLQQFSVTASL